MINICTPIAQQVAEIIKHATLPADIAAGEPVTLGVRSVRPDGRSHHDPSFRWPWPGQWTPRIDADPSDTECSRGLHIALGWRGLSATGPVHVVQIVAYRPADVAHVGATKLRVSQAAVLDVWDVHQMARDGNLSGADLRGANLRYADLSDANLSDANLRYADLSGANLSDANLRDASLSHADLSGANLYRANLPGANLRDASLSHADLSGANLYRANLPGANLPGANLYDANLYDANLRYANLSGANLYDANLRYADLSHADLSHADLSHADLRGASHDEWTQWPTGFSPEVLS
jgi:uncharacterized protein YjbI with pentapeptide repeats